MDGFAGSKGVQNRWLLCNKRDRIDEEIALPRAGASPNGAFCSGGFDPERYKHPWYTRQLLADRAWRELGVTGKGTLNVVHDWNFLFDNFQGFNGEFPYLLLQAAQKQPAQGPFLGPGPTHLGLAYQVLA